MGKYAEFLPHLDDVIFYLKEKLKDPQLMKVSASKLKNGTATPLEVTNANTDYQKALLNQLQYQYQLCNAQIELLKIMGAPIVN
jgi:hypothetical protein